MSVAGIVIFALTYVLISLHRPTASGLDRAGAALLGAVACVACGVLSGDAALAAVDRATLLLLFGVMGMGAYLVADGGADSVERRLNRLAERPRHLLAAIVWGAGAMSAFITNDAVCVLGAPLIVRLVGRTGLPAMPYLLALATAANTGSAATLVGNPQNMLCGQIGDLGYLSYVLVAGPIALLGLAINHGVLLATFHRVLPRNGVSVACPAGATTGSRRSALTAGVVAATALLFSAGAPIAWTAAGGLVVLILVHRRSPDRVWQHIDWSLLVFFAGLFVVVEGFRQSGAVDAIFNLVSVGQVYERAGAFGLMAFFMVGSNLVSNVPFILLIAPEVAKLPDPEFGWTLLAVTSTFAGNLTLLGSAANVIVAESGRSVGGFGFWAHVRVGAPVCILTALAGTFWVWAVTG